MKVDDFLEKRPRIPALVIVEGVERALADRAIAAIEARLREEDPSLEATRWRAPSMESFRPIAEAFSALGFFSARRLLIVRDAHELRAAPRRALWEAASAAAAPSTLVLEDLTAPTRKTKPEPYGQLAGREALRIDTTAPAATRQRFVEACAREAGARLEPAALRLLVDGGADLSTVRGEIERLALTGEPIGVAALSPEAIGGEDPKAYRYAGALIAGDDAAAFATAAELFADDPRGAAVPLLSALATEYALLWELARGGELPARHRWRERVLRPLAARVGARAARRGFERALRGFEAVVTGRTDDPRTLVETIGAECAYERAAATARRR